jgi:glycosyltransferase involved in cell wall biosynthesis
MKRSIAVIFERFGPYHCARLRALAAQGPAVAIEVFRKDTTYQWDVVDDSQGFRRVTLFPEPMAGQPPLGDLHRRLHRCLANEQPRVVAIPGWSAPYARLALSWCLKTHTPAVLMSESTALDRRRTFLGERIKGKLLCLYQAALAGGSRQTQYLRYLGLPKTAVFPGYDVVDNSHFGRCQPGREAWAGPRESFLVCCRFIPEKNLLRLFQAYARYRRTAGSTAWELVIAGDGPEGDRVGGAIKTLHLTGSVRFVGFVQYEGLPAFYGEAGGFILPSVSETWGLVVNEAMAAGLPVLVSNRCGCAPDLVEEGRNGFTFNPYDTEELARLMLRVSSMTKDERAAMGQASREIISRWTPETFATNLIKAVEVAMAAPRPKATLLDEALLSALIHRPISSASPAKQTTAPERIRNFES